MLRPAAAKSTTAEKAMGLESTKLQWQQTNWSPLEKNVSPLFDYFVKEMRAATQMQRQRSEKANYMGGWVNFYNFPTDLTAEGVRV